MAVKSNTPDESKAASIAASGNLSEKPRKYGPSESKDAIQLIVTIHNADTASVFRQRGRLDSSLLQSLHARNSGIGTHIRAIISFPILKTSSKAIRLFWSNQGMSLRLFLAEMFGL